MAGKPRPAARQAFNDNIADAETLVLIVKAEQASAPDAEGTA